MSYSTPTPTKIRLLGCRKQLCWSLLCPLCDDWHGAAVPFQLQLRLKSCLAWTWLLLLLVCSASVRGKACSEALACQTGADSDQNHVCLSLPGLRGGYMLMRLV